MVQLLNDVEFTRVRLKHLLVVRADYLNRECFALLDKVAAVLLEIVGVFVGIITEVLDYIALEALENCCVLSLAQLVFFVVLVFIFEVFFLLRFLPSHFQRLSILADQVLRRQSS
jgi:hypothetical protein